MWQEEGKVVANDLTLSVDPDLLANDADSTRTPKFSLVIGVLAKVNPSAHRKILVQVMHFKQQLRVALTHIAAKRKGPLVAGLLAFPVACDVRHQRVR
jgi:hypothetical protein